MYGWLTRKYGGCMNTAYDSLRARRFGIMQGDSQQLPYIVYNRCKYN